MADTKTDMLPICLPVLPLRGVVMFPQTILNLDVAREKSARAIEHAMKHNRKIFIVAQKDVQQEDPSFSDLYRVGVVAEIQQVVRARNEKLRIMVEGLYRAAISDEVTDFEPFFLAEVTELPYRGLRTGSTDKMNALMRTVKDLYERYCELSPKMSKDLIPNAMLTDDAVYLVDYIGGNMILAPDKKQTLLNENSIAKRLQLLASLLEGEINILTLERELYAKVKEQIDQNQREYYLREQQRAIAEELGEGDNIDNEADEYLKKIEALSLNDEAKEKLTAEVRKLRKLHPSSQEAGVVRGYLDTCLELPWNVYTKDKIDIKAAARLLDREHYGLQKVKERILELLAVRQLAPDISGQIICLVGPPGVGKTSIARSIAEAMGRKYVRMSLGGVRDESDIRGHRKTYIGSMPGRIMAAIKQAGSSNPLMLLDEVDKLGSDYRGDPSAALLEVLDGEQNSAFRDHYIEVPYRPLQGAVCGDCQHHRNHSRPAAGPYGSDRALELHPGGEVPDRQAAPGQEAAQPARTGFQAAAYHRWRAVCHHRQLHPGGWCPRTWSGEIGEICRKSARELVAGDVEKVSVTEKNIETYLGPKRFKPDDTSGKDEVGVVNGLAWTAVGGEMLQVEAAVMDGSGKLRAHRQSGRCDEGVGHRLPSAICAAWPRNRFGIDPEFYKNKDIHIHLPEGAVPKDGPSAGVTLTTALVSALTGTPVRRDVAMTGEITLRGRVLPLAGYGKRPWRPTGLGSRPS